MYRKERDNEILNFIEKYKGSNINTIANLFFSNSKNPYLNASRRLRVLYDNKIIKRSRKSLNDEYVYFINKPITLHKAKLLETYSRLTLIGTINLFEQEMKIPNANRTIDGFIELEVEDDKYINTYPIIIEIDNTHCTSHKKIKDIYNSGYFQKIYNTMPRVLIVNRNDYNIKICDKDIDILNINWNLDCIDDIIK